MKIFHLAQTIFRSHDRIKTKSDAQFTPKLGIAFVLKAVIIKIIQKSFLNTDSIIIFVSVFNQ